MSRHRLTDREENIFLTVHVEHFLRTRILGVKRTFFLMSSVFSTISSLESKAFLKKKNPQLRHSAKIKSFVPLISSLSSEVELEAKNSTLYQFLNFELPFGF